MAGSGSAIRAGRAFVELYADESKLVRGLKAAEGKLKSWGANVTAIGRSIATAGAAILAPLAAATASFTNMGSKLSDLSQRSGLSVEALSTLGYAAQQSGADLDTLGGGIRKMQQNLSDAAGGSEAAAKAFSDLGLNVNELMAMSPDQQFRTIAEAMSGIQDPAKKTAAAMDVFGKSGSDLIPMLNEGRAGIQAMEDRAKALGLVMSGDDATAAAKLGDTWDELMAVGQALMNTIGGALAPAINEVGTTIVTAAAEGVKWLDQNREMIQTVAAVAVGMVAGGAAIAGIGAALSAVGAIVGGVASGIAAVGTVVGVIVSPIGLAVIAVGSLTAAFIYFTDLGPKLLTMLDDVSAKFSEAFGGIVAEIQNGNLEGAWRIAMGGVAVEVSSAMLSVEKVVDESLKRIREKILGSDLNKVFGKMFDTDKAFEFNAREMGINVARGMLKHQIEAAKIKAEGERNRAMFAAETEAQGRTNATGKPLFKPPTLDAIHATVVGNTGGGGAGGGSQGTFNSTAAGRLGGPGGPEVQTAKNTAKTVEQLDKMLNQMKRMKGPSFA